MSSRVPDPPPADFAPTPPMPPGSPPWSDSDDAGIAAAASPPAFATNLSDRAPESLPTIGHIGRYALKYRIGAGGTGTVYAAQDPLLSRLIAIKTLNVEIAAEHREAFNAMFLNEARAAAALSHPHIVTVFDAGVSEQGAYIAMELLKGRDLRQLRADGWKPTPAQSALIVRRVADALAYAHGKGVVHRDVKPANIFMVARTQPRVLDFGIAQVAHHHDANPDDDVAGGSPYYMAPEQVRQEPTDRRADVFALGVVLYELLAGKRPFGGNTLLEIGQAVLAHDPPPANDVNPAAPAALAEIAARAMAKDPDHRYRSARMLSRELRHWLDEHGPATATPALQAASRRRWQALGAVAVSAGVGALLALTLWQDADAPAGEEQRVSVQAPAEAAAAAAPVQVSTEAAAAAPLASQSPAAIPAVRQTTPPLATATPARPRRKPAVAVALPARTEAAQASLAANQLAPSDEVAIPTGVVTIAISPWGNVEVNGRRAGFAPPLRQLTLPEGRHQITIRNEDFPPYRATVEVQAGQAVALKHRFGS